MKLKARAAAYLPSVVERCFELFGEPKPNKFLKLEKAEDPLRMSASPPLTSLVFPCASRLASTRCLALAALDFNIAKAESRPMASEPEAPVTLRRGRAPQGPGELQESFPRCGKGS